MWFEDWVIERPSSPGPNPTSITYESAWEHESYRRDAPYPLEDSFGLTEVGRKGFALLGCRHDVDLLVMIMSEARTVDSIEAWLAQHAKDDSPLRLRVIAHNLALMVNRRICRGFYSELE